MPISLRFLFALLLLVPVSSSAQPVPTDTLDLGEVTVTAERAPVAAARTAAAVSVMTAEEIERQPLLNLADALRLTPGFAFLNGDGAGTPPSATVRRFYGGGEAEYVLLLINGRPVNDVETGLVDWELVPLGAVERVEVLRGGASPLWGDAAIGAVVNVVTKDGAQPVRVAASGGSYDTYFLSGNGGGTWRGRSVSAYGSVKRYGGWRDHASRTVGLAGARAEVLRSARGSLALATRHAFTDADLPGPLLGPALAAGRTLSSPFYRFDGTEERRHRASLDGRWQALPGLALDASLLGGWRSATVTRTLPLSPEFGDTKRRDLDGGRLELDVQATAGNLGASDRTLGLPVAARLVVGATGSLQTLESSYSPVIVGAVEDYLTGQIWIVTADGNRLGTPFLDIQDRLVELNEGYDERGLLGLSFHPDYAENGRFFVFYSAPLRESAPDGFDHTNVLAEFRASPANADVADPTSEKVLMKTDHPYMNHNAGTLAFGPEDRYLYVALGDGGHRDDQDVNFVQGRPEDWYEVNDGGNGQDLENNLLGSILRIDVDAEGEGGHHGSNKPYVVPEDNPFTGIPGVMGEVWAYGLRNPWRFSFDPAGDHDLIAADVGQNLYDEISVVTKGGNYGWNVWEGRHCFNAASPTDPFASCPTETGTGHPVEGDPLAMPVIEAKNSGYFEDGLGVAIVGGVVYRGLTLPRLAGRYLFGVYSRSMQDGHKPGRVFVATREGDDWPFEEMTFANRPGGELDVLLLSFGQDRTGEVYLLTTDSPDLAHAKGSVYRLVPSP